MTVKTCSYKLTNPASKTQLIPCPNVASCHIEGYVMLPRGADAQGERAVTFAGDYCDRHTKTMRNRAASASFRPFKETP